MIHLIEKSKKDLDEKEKEQLERIIKRYYKGAKQEFLDQRLRDGPDFHLVLQKEDDEIQAASFYHSQKKAGSPFSKHANIVHFGISVKKEGYKGNVIWKNGSFYARKNFGRSWLFKSGIGISAICNPKVLENFIKLFPFNYPFSKQDDFPKVIEFLDGYFKERNMNIVLDQDFCFHDNNLYPTDITQEYDRYYRSKNEKINERFFELGLFEKHKENIFLTGKHMVICGYRNMFDFNKGVK
jgi:hypothetical protein